MTVSLGNLLVRERVISGAQLAEALAYQKRSGRELFCGAMNGMNGR